MHTHTHTPPLLFLNSLVAYILKQIKAYVILSFVSDIKSWWLKQSACSNQDKSSLDTFTKQSQNYKQGCILQAFAPQWARPKKILLTDFLGLLFKKKKINVKLMVISLPDSLWVLAYGCHGNLIILACSLHILFISLDFLIIQKTPSKNLPSLSFCSHSGSILLFSFI